MYSAYYGSVFALSMIFAAVYLWMWHKHFDVHFTLIFTLIPVACLGYYLGSRATTLEGALTAQKIIYIGGSFLQLFVVYSILNMCRIGMPRWLRAVLFLLCAAVYSSVLTIGASDLFYTGVSLDTSSGSPQLVKEYGRMHTVFYVLLAGFLITGIAAIIYTWFRRKYVPRRTLMLLAVPDLVCVMTYFIVLKVLSSDVDLVPLGYVIAELTYLLIARRVNLHDVSDTVIDSFVRESRVGYVSFDFRRRYLGSNSVARRLVPALADLRADGRLDTALERERPDLLPGTPGLHDLRRWLDSFEADPGKNEFLLTWPGEEEGPEDDQFYQVRVNHLYDGRHRRGYILIFTDDTANQKLLRIKDEYNTKLEQDVDKATRHIRDMHDNLILSLAMMIESRDNSTGGHIKRTREGVRILLKEIVREGKLNLDDEFCRNMIKAAPMHDLGKIAVDDAVLRKEGRFTEEEYAKMKRHPVDGARVIHEILLHTDNESFKQIAENVAHYHHERWDGRGYPDGLSGEQIPLEARIMAVADVYDALVSKRVYKEAFSFEKADRIILEGMGTQFDPGLKDAYIQARPELEAYYSAGE